APDVRAILVQPSQGSDDEPGLRVLGRLVKDDEAVEFRHVVLVLRPEHRPAHVLAGGGCESADPDQAFAGEESPAHRPVVTALRVVVLLDEVAPLPSGDMPYGVPHPVGRCQDYTPSPSVIGILIVWR